MEPEVHVDKVDKLDRVDENIEFDAKKLGIETLHILGTIATERGTQLSRKATYTRLLYEHVYPLRVGPWENSANFHIPLTMRMVKVLHSKFWAAFFSVYPCFLAVPGKGITVESARVKEQFMRWAVYNYVNRYQGILPTFDSVFWETSGFGWSVLMLRWDKIQRRGMKWTATRGADGKIKRSRKKQTVTVFDGPSLVHVPQEDCFLLPGYDDIQTAPFFARGLWLTPSQLYMYAESGYFYKEAVQRVLEPPTGDPKADKDKQLTEAGTQSRVSSISPVVNVAQTLDKIEGVETVHSGAEVNAVRVYEVYRTVDLDKDGLDEEVVYWMEEKTGEILRCVSLDQISPTGTRCIYKTSLIKIPFRAYPMGLCSLLYPISTELDAIHNLRIDAQTLVVTPWFVYKPAPGFSSEEIKIKPGIGVPVENTASDIRFPSMPQNPAQLAQEEANLISLAEGLAGLEGPMIGHATDPIGAGRTATGMSIVAENLTEGLQVWVERMQDVFKNILNDLDVWLQWRAPEGLEYKIVGPDGAPEKDESGQIMDAVLDSRDALVGKMNYMLVGNTKALNRALEYQNAVMRNQTLVNELDIKLGLQTPKTIYELRRDLLVKQGEIDPSRFLNKPPGEDQPVEVFKEIAMLNHNIMPPIVMNDNHQEKIEVLSGFVNRPAFLEGIKAGTIHPDAPTKYALAIERHKEYADAIMKHQGMSQNISGMQVAPTLSARMSGQVNQKTEQPIAEESLTAALQPAGSSEGGE